VTASEEQDDFQEFRQRPVPCPSCGRKALRPRVRTTDFRCQACGEVFSHDEIEARAQDANQSDTISTYVGCGCGLVAVVGLIVGISKFVMGRSSHRDSDVEAVTASTSQASSGAAPPSASAARSSAPTPSSIGKGRTAPADRSCTPCSTQEDFDRVQKAGSLCCPVRACESDVDCQAGRVCCKIPGGQLCGDETRCKGPNRVSEGK
jgi:ribosomal protein L37AE/L43A